MESGSKGWIKKLPRYRWSWNEGVYILPRHFLGAGSKNFSRFSLDLNRLLLTQGLKSISIHGKISLK